MFMPLESLVSAAVALESYYSLENKLVTTFRKNCEAAY